MQYYAESAKLRSVHLWFSCRDWFIWMAGRESKEGQGMYKLISALFVLLTCTDMPRCRKEVTI